MLAGLAAALLLAAGPEDAARAADVALDRAVAAGDAAAFAALLEEDAAFAGSRGIALGRTAVVQAWKLLLSPGGPRLRWAPVRAEVAASGDLAFTTGRWTLEATGEDGKAARAEGEYVTVWRRGADGAWRALLDGGLVPAERLGAGLARVPLRSATSAAGDLDAVLGTWTRGAEKGFWLLVRRRAPDGGWTIAVDSALSFAPG